MVGGNRGAGRGPGRGPGRGEGAGARPWPVTTGRELEGTAGDRRCRDNAGPVERSREPTG